MEKTGNFRNMWRLNHMLLSNQWVKEEIKREDALRQMKTKIYQNLWDLAKKSCKRGVPRDKCLPRETRVSAIRLKEIEIGEETKPKVSRRNEIIKIRAEIEIKKTVE